jgi:hypothetical protein
MQAPREQDSFGRRPRLSIVGSRPRSRRWGLSRERGGRLPAHPLEFDERGVPIDQPPLTAVERLGGLLTG